MEPDSCVKTTKITYPKSPKPAKFIVIQDVFKKRELEMLANPPQGIIIITFFFLGGTNFIFWYNTGTHEDPSGWGNLTTLIKGLTIKQMTKTEKNKSSAHVWKCSW